MVYQVWILGPGDVPTAAHELWEDDRMELLVRKFCGHFFPALEHCMLNGILKVSFSMPNFHVLQSFCQPTIIFFHVSEREKSSQEK